MPSPLAATRKVSLAGIDEAWEEGSHAVVKLMSFLERSAAFDKAEAKDFKNKAETAAWELEQVVKHFVSGAVNGAVVAVEHLNEAPQEVIDTLYLAIMGISADPKDLSTTTASQPTPAASTEPSDSTSNTKTQ